MAVNEILGALQDRGLLRQLGREIAEGMAGASTRSVFGPDNATGRDQGVAGGRGNAEQRREAQDLIKYKQLEAKYVNQITKSYKMLNQELDKTEKDTKKARTSTFAYSKIFGETWNEAMKHVESSTRSQDMLIKKLNGSLDENIETMDDVLKIRQRQLALEKRILDQDAIVSERTIKEYNKLSKALSEASVGIEDYTKNLTDNAKRVVRGFFTIEAALANLSIATKQLVEDFRAQLRFGSQMGVLANQIQAMTMGIDPGAFTEINAQARQASLTFGSLDEYTSTLRDQQLRYFNQIGDLTEATRFTAQSFQLLGRSGVRPNVEAMDSMASSFRVLNKIAGVTSDQFSGMMEGLLLDQDIQGKLRGAQEGQRQAIIAGIAKQLEMNVAMGMTVEQATEAARSLGRLAGGSARERFKQAAMTQATMGAMGIAGGAEAADLIRKGQRRTVADNERLQELMSQVSNEASEARMGGYGAEMMVDTMMDKSGMGQWLGPDSPFNTNLTNGLAANKSVLEQIRDGITDQMTIGEKALVVADTVGNFIMNGALGKLLTGVAQLIGAYVIGRGALGMLGRGAGGLGGMLGRGGALGRAGTAIRTAAGGITAGGAAAGLAAGVGVYQAGQAITTGRSDVHDLMTSTETGQTISDYLGAGIARTLAFFGHDESEEAVRLMDEQKQQQQRQTALAEQAADVGATQNEILMRQLEEQRKTRELAQAQFELQEGAITYGEFSRRVSRINEGGQSARLYGNTGTVW